MAWAMLELKREGMTMMAACKVVADMLPGCRGFEERGYFKTPPSAIAIRSRFKRLRASQLGRKALRETGDLTPEIQRVPRGRKRALAILEKLFDPTFDAPPTPWLDWFKEPVKHVTRINVPTYCATPEEP